MVRIFDKEDEKDKDEDVDGDRTTTTTKTTTTSCWGLTCLVIRYRASTCTGNKKLV